MYCDYANRNVSLDWQALKEATSYQWQLSYNTSFSAIPSGFDGTTDASSAHLPTLEPGTTYYWRARATAPVLSPWSDKRSFTTSLDTEVTTLTLESPKAGTSGVQVKPVFQWSAIAGADAYELMVSTASSFTSPLISRTGNYALPATAWQCDLSLKNGTTYYWKVRAVNSNTASAWSATGTFTTEASPPAVPPVTPPAPVVAPLPTPAPSPTARAQSAPAAPAQLAPLSTAPAPASSQPSVPPAAATTPVPAILNWIVYLTGALLLATILLLVIILLLVVRTKRI